MIKTFLVSVVIDACLNALDRTISRRMMMPSILADIAAGKKLSAKFTIDEIFDIKMLMGSNIENEMMKALHKEITVEIDNYIIGELKSYSNRKYG